MENRKRVANPCTKSNKRQKIPTIISQTIQSFELIEDAEKKMYKCLLCSDVHSQFYFDNIETRVKEPLEVKRLNLIQNAVETVTVNGRPFNYLLDSGYQHSKQTA